MIESLQVPIACTLQIISLSTDANLHRILRVRHKAITVVNNAQSDVIDIEGLERVLADNLLLQRKFLFRRHAYGFFVTSDWRERSVLYDMDVYLGPE